MNQIRKPYVLIGILMIFGSFFIRESFAEESRQNEGKRRGHHRHKMLCQDDVQKLCPDVEKGQGRILKCLSDHKSEWSDSCKEDMKRHDERMKKKMEKCQADVDSHCAEHKGNPMEVMKCLRENKDKVSSECSESLKKRRGNRGRFHEFCGEDLKKHWPKDQYEGKDALKGCMDEKQSELSQKCQGFMKNFKKRHRGNRGPKTSSSGTNQS